MYLICRWFLIKHNYTNMSVCMCVYVCACIQVCVWVGGCDVGARYMCRPIIAIYFIFEFLTNLFITLIPPDLYSIL